MALLEYLDRYLGTLPDSLEITHTHRENFNFVIKLAYGGPSPNRNLTKAILGLHTG